MGTPDKKASELFSDEQNEDYQRKVDSGEIDLSEDIKERRKNARKNEILKLAEKYKMSVRGVNLRLVQNRKNPIDTLDFQMENEKKIVELEEHIQVVERLYKKLRIEHDELKESVGDKSGMINVLEISEQMGKPPQEVAGFLAGVTTIPLIPAGDIKIPELSKE